jgi:hypothetical protein
MRTYLRNKRLSTANDSHSCSEHALSSTPQLREQKENIISSPSPSIPLILLTAPKSHDTAHYPTAAPAEREQRKPKRRITDYFPTIHQSNTISDSIHQLKRQTVSPTSSSCGSNNRTLTQLYLGGNHDKVHRCQECGMSFIPHVSSDVQAHFTYHSFTLQGIPVGPAFSAGDQQDGHIFQASKLQRSKVIFNAIFV